MAVAIGLSGFYWLFLRDKNPTGKPAVMITLASGKQVAGFEEFLDLHSTDQATVKFHLNNIERGWHPGAATMLIEMTQSVKFHSSRQSIFATLVKKTGQSFGDDADRWLQWIWNQEYAPHPQYPEFKSELYGQIDPHFANYFRQTDGSKIRLDEIRWGGVLRNGIPPLKNPKMISVQQAEYLADSNVVFGVNLNGDARCYPKRILAWHEMFNDTIGGEPVCGVY